MPAAAVIPAPIAYIKVVAVKKLVVGSRDGSRRSAFLVCTVGSVLCFDGEGVDSSFLPRIVYLEKIRVFKAGVCLNILAWNNGIGLWCYFVGFEDRSND